MSETNPSENKPGFTGEAIAADELTTMHHERLRLRLGETVQAMKARAPYGLCAIAGSEDCGTPTLFTPTELLFLLFYTQLGLAHREAQGTAGASFVLGVARRLESAIDLDPVAREVLRRGWVKVPGTPEFQAAFDALGKQSPVPTADNQPRRGELIPVQDTPQSSTTLS